MAFVVIIHCDSCFRQITKSGGIICTDVLAAIKEAEDSAEKIGAKYEYGFWKCPSCISKKASPA